MLSRIVPGLYREGLATHEAFMEFSPQQLTGAIEYPAQQARRVLVIDDDGCVGAAIQSILARRRYQTVLAPRAGAGIQALQQSQFDLVMVDIFMPGLSGLDTIEHIRRSSPIPIIAMSGFRLRSSADSVDCLEMAVRLGATLCLRKPFQPAQLIDAVEWSSGLRGRFEGSMN
jgi:CheY-like chemotaxis protein